MLRQGEPSDYSKIIPDKITCSMGSLGLLGSLWLTKSCRPLHRPIAAQITWGS